ncbi:MAG: decarboxylase [Pseudomonadota bacterium]|nr:decarboxylase [Pseudomonadota bacterium]
MPETAGPSGTALISALKKAGVYHIAALPDITTSAGLLWPVSEDPELTLIRLSKEDEGVSICAALSYCEKRAVLLMQQTGLMDSLNNVRAVGCEYEQPVCMLVGLLGKEADRAPTESANFGVRIIQPVLDAMEIDHILIEGTKDVGHLTASIDRAYKTSQPMVALIGRRVRP